MINETKMEMYTELNELKEDTCIYIYIYKQPTEVRENSNKHLKEIKKTMQDTKDELSKGMEILKKSS
jgi:ElaB/YqjD/DUF883 family membrane-anchored ribosome-binding protein